MKNKILILTLTVLCLVPNVLAGFEVRPTLAQTGEQETVKSGASDCTATGSKHLPGDDSVGAPSATGSSFAASAREVSRPRIGIR